MTELIVFERNQRIFYFDNCILNFDAEQKQFDIISEDDGLEINITNFTHNFCRKNNIFCVFENENCGFAIIFSNKQRCDEIIDSYKHLKKSSANGFVINNSPAILRLFLSRIFNEIQTNENPSFRLIKIANEIIGSLSDKEKLDFIDILPNQKVKDVKMEDIIDLTLDEDEVKKEPSIPVTISFPSICFTSEENCSEQSDKLEKRFVDQESPENSLRRNIAVDDEYDTFSPENISNIVDGASKLKKQKLISLGKSSKSQKLSEKVKVSDFNFEQLLQKEINAMGSNFAANNEQEENHQSITTPTADKSDFINAIIRVSESLRPSSSKMKMKKASKEILKISNFKLEFIINASGQRYKQLTIYDSSELCRIYNFEKSQKLFYCTNCKLLGKTVAIRIHGRISKEIMVSYGTNQHICKPQKERTIFHQIEINKNKNGKIVGLVIFDNGNKYYFYSFYGTTFRCRGCYSDDKNICNVLLFQKTTGEYYAKHNYGEHTCNPLKYSADNI